MKKDCYELSVLVRSSGQVIPIKEYGHKGLTFVEGRKDQDGKWQSYSLRFRNNSAMRVLAVISVDGVGVVDGKAATPSSRGYVVAPYSATEIKGWRSSLEKVNDFVFNPKTGSYSAQTQAEGDINCGIIEVKVFTEDIAAWLSKEMAKQKANPPVEHHHHHYPIIEPLRPPWTPWTPMWSTITCSASNANSAPSMVKYTCSLPDNSAGQALAGEVKSMSFNCCATPPDAVGANFVAVAASAPAQENPDFNLGTAWGTERTDVVSEVDFERGAEQAMLTVYYSDAEGLKKAGIEVNKDVAVAKPLPRGFNGFCQPPKASQ